VQWHPSGGVQVTLQPRQLPGSLVELVIIAKLMGKVTDKLPLRQIACPNQPPQTWQPVLPLPKLASSASVLDLSLKLTKGFAVRCVPCKLASSASVLDLTLELTKVRALLS
jgi:hypothetical protein